MPYALHEATTAKLNDSTYGCDHIHSEPTIRFVFLQPRPKAAEDEALMPFLEDDANSAIAMAEMTIAWVVSTILV